MSNLPQGVTYLFGEGGSSSNVSGMTAYSHTWTAREAWRVNFGKELVGSIGIVVSYATNRGGIYDKNSSTGVNWLILDNGTSATSTTSRDLDAVAHEYGHGVFDQVVAAHSTIPSFDDFAMSEGYADFSSVLTTRYASGNSLPPAPAVWQLLDVKLPNQQPIRSWSSPRSVSSQARDWYTDRSTAIDPHNNSHVMGHALYLLSQGGVHARVGGPVSDRPGAVIPSINVPAQGFDKMIRIFNAAFGYPGMQAYPDFLKLREAMEDRAYTLYGMASKDAVSKAWEAVGVRYNCSAPPAVPTLKVTSYLCRGQYRISWPDVLAATSYYVETVRVGYPWSLATPTVDGNVNACTLNLPYASVIRMRSCNSCGCSNWTAERYLSYYDVCR